MRLFSKGCEHVLRALTEIPAEAENRFSIRMVCRRAKLPEPFTRKMFQRLVQKGVLEARQGPGGGYSLRVSPQKISVWRIVEAIDGPGSVRGCVLGSPECNGRRICPLHQNWKRIRSTVIRELKSTMLGNLRLDDYVENQGGRL